MTRFSVHGTTLDLVEACFKRRFPQGFTILPIGDRIIGMDFIVDVQEEVSFLQSASMGALLKEWGAKQVLTTFL